MAIVKHFHHLLSSLMTSELSSDFNTLAFNLFKSLFHCLSFSFTRLHAYTHTSTLQIWSQSYQTVFLRKRRIFPFFAYKLDHFLWIHIFPFLTNTQAYQQKSENRKNESLVGSTPGVNFTNSLRAAFRRADPKSEKKTVKLSSFLHFWDLRA